MERPQLRGENPKLNSEKWMVNTQKKCSKLEKLPKVQQFVEYNFVDRKGIDQAKYKTKFSDTDHISVKVPKAGDVDVESSYLNLKKKYGAHTETYNDCWMPQGNFKTMNNRSSVRYDIISNGGIKHGGSTEIRILDKKLANRKKGVAEFCDIPQNNSYNKKFAGYLDENKRVFHAYKGIFSHMYDAAHRNGNIVVPFRKGDNNKKLPGKVNVIHRENSSGKSKSSKRK